MANQKISQLPSAITTSNGDLYPLVQSSANYSITFTLLQSAILSGLSVFTPTSAGLVPSSGGGTSNFLRADGTWASPASGSTASTIENTLVAGESFSANTSCVVRWGMNSLSETSNRVYAADYDTSSEDEFWIVGIGSSTSSVASGEPITVYSFGIYTLASSDMPFLSSDIGNPVWLTANGAFSAVVPVGNNEANLKIGIVMNLTQIWLNDQMMGVGNSNTGGGGSEPASDVAYTPGDPTKWASTPPSTVQEALDRLAAVVGASIPIP